MVQTLARVEYRPLPGRRRKERAGVSLLCRRPDDAPGDIHAVAGGFPSLLLCLGLVASGCSENKPAAPPGPPPAVTVVRATPQLVRASTSFTGRIQATDKVDLRARVEGFLEKRQFVEGADVKQGDLLFVIEKGLYQAALDEAKAGLAKAEADLKLAEVEFERQKELFARNVGSQAKLDEATAKQGEARANLLAQKAGVEKATLQLGYTDVAAPLAEHQSPISVGTFVGPSSGSLATIVSQDRSTPAFDDAAECWKFAGRISEPRRGDDPSQLADGKPYGGTGKINFLDVTVNPGTDTVRVAQSFPIRTASGRRQLATVVVESGDGESVLVVPQQALQLDQTGPVHSGGRRWRVESAASRPAPCARRHRRAQGARQEQRVITEGIQRVRPGQAVQAAEIKPAG